MQAYPTGCCGLEPADICCMGAAIEDPTIEHKSVQESPRRVPDPAFDVAAGIHAWVVRSVNRS